MQTKQSVGYGRIGKTSLLSPRLQLEEPPMQTKQWVENGRIGKINLLLLRKLECGGSERMNR